MPLERSLENNLILAQPKSSRNTNTGVRGHHELRCHINQLTSVCKHNTPDVDKRSLPSTLHYSWAALTALAVCARIGRWDQSIFIVPKNEKWFYVSNASQTLHNYEMHGFLGISNFVLFANFMRTWIGNLRMFWKVCAMLRARVKYKAQSTGTASNLSIWNLILNFD